MVKTFPDRCQLLVNGFENAKEIIAKYALLCSKSWELILIQLKVSKYGVIPLLNHPLTLLIGLTNFLLESLDYQKLATNKNVYQFQYDHKVTS